MKNKVNEIIPRELLLNHPSKNSMEYWLQQLTKCSTEQVTAVVKTGKLLLDAKHALKGKWVEFKKSQSSPYTPRKTEMLMRIAKHPVLSNAQHFALLPEAWTVLHALTAIKQPLLEKLVNEGRVNPRLTLKQAKELNPDFKATPAKPLSASALVRMKERIEESIPHWESDQGEATDQVAECLSEIKEQIEQVQPKLQGEKV